MGFELDEKIENLFILTVLFIYLLILIAFNWYLYLAYLNNILLFFVCTIISIIYIYLNLYLNEIYIFYKLSI